MCCIHSVHAYIHVCITCIHPHTPTHARTHARTHVHTCTHTHMHTHMHTYTHAHTYTHTHTHTHKHNTTQTQHAHVHTTLYHYSEFNSTEKTVNQIRAEIDMQLKEKENIEKTLPQNIVIGPFFVNCDTIRQALSKKCKELANALLEYVVSRLKRKSDEVSILTLSMFFT